MDRMKLLDRLIAAGWDCEPAKIPAHVMQAAERGQPVPRYVPDPKATRGRGTSDGKREQRFAAMRERQEAARERELRDRDLVRRHRALMLRRRRESPEEQLREQQRLVERATRTIQHLEGRLMKEGGQQHG